MATPARRPIATLEGRLRMLRLARGLSQREVAEQTAISLSLVSKLERGEKTDLRLSCAVNLAATLRCHPGWLVFGVGQIPRGLAA